MKCPEAEEKIFLYRELTAADRENIDEHLKTCMLCRQTMSSAIDMQDVIACGKADVPSMTNEAQITRRIMDAIQETQKRQILNWEKILRSFQASSLRYGMSALSFALVMFFIAEYAGGENMATVTKSYPQHPGMKTELNIASFHTAFFSARDDGRQTSTLISECVTGCLQSQDPDCKKCVKKFAKQ